MSYSNPGFITLADKMRRLFTQPEREMVAGEELEPRRLCREELTELFQLNAAAATRQGNLRQSERREHDTMTTLRAALYSEN